jgi:hypothetical protein
MHAISEAFALNATVSYFSFHDLPAKTEITWSNKGRGRVRLFFGKGIYTEYDTEYDAWVAAVAHSPKLLNHLAESQFLQYRTFALRAEMMLGMGLARFEDMKEAVNAEVFQIYETALSVLDASKKTKSTPKVARVSQAKTFSWLEVRTRVKAPYLASPVLLCIRCLPSPLEDHTWAVRVRMPTISDEALREVQSRVDELTRMLGYRGITVKDVQNGTQLDL